MAKQDNITFEKGMLPQIDRLSKIPGSYIEAVNMMRDDSGNIQNEIGTSSVFELSTGFKIVGVANLGEDIVIASTNDVDSRIGVLGINDTYTPVVNNIALNFKKVNRVNIETKVNYKGERIIYLAGKGIKLRTINLNTVSAITTEEFDRITSLFLEYALPRTEFEAVSTGGEVLSGVYQFATRLITGSNNATSFGPLTGIIPIGVGNPSGSRKDYDGGDPQTLTSNRITIKISNIDTAFEFIEPCVITYIGEANVASIKSLGKIPINNRESIDFVYSGPKVEITDILEEELNVDITNYESANYLTQKDNTLILAGLEEIEDTMNWQEIANSITIRYITHEVNSNENIDIQAGGVSWKTFSDRFRFAGQGPWVDSGIGGDFEDYKNPATCAKFMSYKRDEIYSFTFTPIYTTGRKGNAFHIPAKTPTDSTTLRYVEVEGVFYPDNFGSFSGKQVRYHKMPSNVDAPFNYISNGLEKISILGIEVDIPNIESWKDKVAGYIIGRENRTGKETIISQGLIKGIYKTGEGLDYAIIPSFGSMRIDGTDKANRFGDSWDHRQIFSYYSPDLITEDKIFIPSKLKRIAILEGSIEYANTHFELRTRYPCNNLISCKPLTPTSDIVTLDPRVITLKTASRDPLNDDPRVGGSTNEEETIFDIAKIVGRRFLTSKILKVDGNINTYPKSQREDIDFFFDQSSPGGIFKPQTIGTDYQILSDSPFPVDLYEIERSNTFYYGNIYDKESFPLVTVLFRQTVKDPRTGANISNLKPIIFGGDTFISRYAHTFKDSVPFYGAIEDRQDVPKSDSTIYFMLESPYNYNYRHYRVGNDVEEGSVPYYPKYKILQNGTNGINEFPVRWGHSELYNKQYSAQNTFQYSYTAPIDLEVITKFNNRVIYSATSIEGEKFDAYRLFLPGNYHDIPKQYGSITGLFVQGNELYTHTERALWRCFYNSLATQATSEGDIVLGNGGAFPRPSVPIITNNGGYAGCLDISASVGTPMGRYFYDANNSKLFRLFEGLQEISNPAIFDLLRKSWNNAQVVLGYDTGRKRILLTGNNKGISYRPELSSFDGLHEYSFDHFISRSTKDYLLKDSLIHKYDDTVFGKYFNIIKNSKIVVNSVVHPSISKRYTSAEIVITSKTPQGLNLPFEFLDKLQAYSLEKNTGLNNFHVIKNYTEDLETLGNVFVYKANNKFRFGFPPDLVYDINKNIQDITNLVTYSGFTDEDRIFLPDLIDNHLILELIIDNNNQRFLKINSFIINFEPNIT